MNTYTETVNRYRIVRHEELPEEHKQCYRDAGINPDDNWQLIWSFEDEEFAAEKLQEIQKHAPLHWTYKLVDGGEATTIERPAW